MRSDYEKHTNSNINTSRNNKSMYYTKSNIVRDLLNQAKRMNEIRSTICKNVRNIRVEWLNTRVSCLLNHRKTKTKTNKTYTESQTNSYSGLKKKKNKLKH